MDDDRRAAHQEVPRTIVTGDDPRRLRAVIVVLVAVIVVLLVRPWGEGASRDAERPGTTPAARSGLIGSGGAPGSAPATAGLATEPSGAATGTAADRYLSCGSPDGWRATTVQSWPVRALPVRSWIAIDPVRATDPTDPAIPLAPVAASLVTAIGYCAPLATELRPPSGARAMLWIRTPAGALRLSPVGLDPVSAFREGVLWLPAPQLADIPRKGGVTAWPPGSYVIEITDDGHVFDSWLGLEILDLEQGRGPEDSPGVSRGASPSPSGAAPNPSPGTAAPGGSAAG